MFKKQVYEFVKVFGVLRALARIDVEYDKKIGQNKTLSLADVDTLNRERLRDAMKLLKNRGYADAVFASLERSGISNYRNTTMETLQTELIYEFLRRTGHNADYQNKPHGNNSGDYYEFEDYIIGIIKNSKVSGLIMLDGDIFKDNFVTKGSCTLKHNIYYNAKGNTESYRVPKYVWKIANNLLHRVIYTIIWERLDDKDEIDHKAIYRGDNTLGNLRKATSEQNHRNSSRSKSQKKDEFTYNRYKNFSKTGFLLAFRYMGLLTEEQILDYNHQFQAQFTV